jgi:hypothetical protein
MSDLLRITERYRLDKLIHASDTASVFRAVDLRSGETVALKLIRGEIDESRRDGRVQFEGAARALQECRHTSLPRILDHGFTGTGGAFLVAEYLMGASFELFAGSPVGRVLPLLLPVLDGLEELERHQLAHRNLRADNLLVVPAGDEERLVILGWGTAAATTGEEGRRADLRGFAEITCAAIGAEIQHEPSLAVVMPAAAAGDPIADAPELAMLLSLLLQPGTAAPAGLYAELRRAFRQALLGDPGPAVQRRQEGAGAVPALASQATPETPEPREVVDLDQTRAVAADVTIAVPRDRLLGALDKMSASGAAAAAASGPPTASGGAQTASSSTSAASSGASTGRDAAGAASVGSADDAAAAPAAAAVNAGPELRLVSAPLAEAAPPLAGAVRGDTLPVFRAEDLGGSAAGAAAAEAPAAEPPGSLKAATPGAVVPDPQPAPAPPPPLRPATVTLLRPPARRAAGTTRSSRLASPLPAGAAVSWGAAAHPMAAAEEQPAPALDSLLDAAAAQETAAAGHDLDDSGQAGAAAAAGPAGTAAEIAAVRASTSGAASTAAADAVAAAAAASAQARGVRRRAGLARHRSAAVAAGVGIAALAAVVAVAFLRQPAARRHAPPAAPRSPAAASTRAAARPRLAAAPPAALPGGAAAPAVVQPASGSHLQAADELLAGGDAAGARRELALVSSQEQAGFTPADRATYDRLAAALAADRRRQIGADLAAALRRGDIRRIKAALTAAKWEPDLPAATRRDLDRARQAIELDARLERSDLGQAPRETLRNATDLLTLVPRHARASELRDQAAKATEDQADAALAAGDYERAAALLDGLRQAWPERSGLKDRFDRLESQRRGDGQLDAVLAAASRAEAAGQPLQGLELLAGANPGTRYRDRFRRQRERLEGLLARLDAAPPSISLRPGFKLEYDKGASIAVRLRITDDLAVKSAECWVRPEGSPSYEAVPVRHLSGADYEVDIPPELHQNRNLDLYAAASDNSGHRSLLGSKDQPLKLKRRTWIEKLFTGKQGGAPAGGAGSGTGPSGPPPPGGGAGTGTGPSGLPAD